MQTQSNVDQVLLIDKPKGITSYDVIRKLKTRFPRGIKIGQALNLKIGQALNLKIGQALNLKIGHAGTLDPNATGLLIVGIGAGTKKLKDFIGLNKEYKADILLGIRTDTGDITGKILKSVHLEALPPSGEVSEDEIKEIVSGMVGKWNLPVSAYSAMKQGGEPLYKKVRRGEKPILPVREMEVFTADFIGQYLFEGMQVLKVRFIVSSGTYIRSLAEELGKRLDIVATLKELRRTRVGEFRVEDAEIVF